MAANRENDFVLLGLKPSESDRRVIEAKINEMEKKWRDLVAKLGRPEHKRYLERIPDIRERMLNADTRAKEARAAILVAEIDSSAYAAAQKNLPESYRKIEDGLKLGQYTDIYDFLGRDPASGLRCGHYNMTDHSTVLVERAKELLDAYRQLPDEIDRMRLSSLLIDFLGSGYKTAYDTYIMVTVKQLLANALDTLFAFGSRALDKHSLSKLTSTFTRLYFPQEEVAAFIEAYCEYKGYAIPLTDNAPTSRGADNPHKKLIRFLQQNMSQLIRVIDKQQAHINALSVKEKGMDTRIPRHKEYAGQLKGAILHQFAFKEVIHLTTLLAKGQTITDSERAFYDIYVRMFEGETVLFVQKKLLWDYVQSRYSQQINALTAPSAEEITECIATFERG